MGSKSNFCPRFLFHLALRMVIWASPERKNNNWHTLWLVCVYVTRFQIFNHLSLKLTVLDGGKHKDNIYYTRTSSSFQGIAAVTRRLEVGKRLWGDTARPAEPKWWKGYSIQCNVMPSSKTGVVGEERERQDGFQKQPPLRDWLGITLLVQTAKWLLLHHLLGFPPFFLHFSCPFLSLWVLGVFSLPSLSPVLLG